MSEEINFKNKCLQLSHKKKNISLIPKNIWLFETQKVGNEYASQAVSNKYALPIFELHTNIGYIQIFITDSLSCINVNLVILS